MKEGGRKFNPEAESLVPISNNRVIAKDFRC